MDIIYNGKTYTNLDSEEQIIRKDGSIIYANGCPAPGAIIKAEESVTE